MTWEIMERYCPVCGLPCQSRHVDLEGIDHELRRDSLPGPSQDQISQLEASVVWLDHVRLLCDPDDEVGRLVPTLAYENLDKPWMGGKPSRLLRQDPEQPWPRSKIQDFEGRQEAGPEFHRLEPDRTHCVVNVDKADFPTFDGRAYVPVHSACLHMAKIVLASSSNKYLNDIRGFWTAIRWRQGIASHFDSWGPQANYTLGLCSWYRPFWNILDCAELDSRKAQWPGPSPSPLFNLHYLFLSNPVEIEGVTEDIISNLAQFRSDVTLDDKTRSLRERLAALPQDIYHLIVASLRSCRDLPRHTTHSLPQDFWKKELMLGSRGLLPWLWDIDPQVIEAKACEPCPEGSGYEWNWELLVRQLSRGVDAGIRHDVPEHVNPYNLFPLSLGGLDVEDVWTCSGYYDDLPNVPSGLYNRRRIWQLLEEMFVDDTLPIAGESDTWDSYSPLSVMERAVEMHWTKSGELRKAPIWLPSINPTMFVRRIGGEVYKISDRSPGDQKDHAEEQIKDTSAEETTKSLQNLGYPLSI